MRLLKLCCPSCGATWRVWVESASGVSESSMCSRCGRMFTYECLMKAAKKGTHAA